MRNWRHDYIVFTFVFQMAVGSFENLDNILHYWAKDKYKKVREA